MKDPIAMKALVCIGLTCTALAPKAMYIASDKYIRTYNQGSNYISELTEHALSKVGLTTIKPESNENLESIVQAEALRYKLNPKLLSALIKHESAENADALSLKAAIGYAQIMPDNYKRCGLSKKSELWDIKKNIRCGAQILSEELNTNKGDLEKALFSYNGGPKAYPNKYPESVKHAATVMKIFAQNSL